MTKKLLQITLILVSIFLGIFLGYQQAMPQKPPGIWMKVLSLYMKRMTNQIYD